MSYAAPHDLPTSASLRILQTRSGNSSTRAVGLKGNQTTRTRGFGTGVPMSDVQCDSRFAGQKKEQHKRFCLCRIGQWSMGSADCRESPDWGLLDGIYGRICRYPVSINSKWLMKQMITPVNTCPERKCWWSNKPEDRIGRITAAWILMKKRQVRIGAHSRIYQENFGSNVSVFCCHILQQASGLGLIRSSLERGGRNQRPGRRGPKFSAIACLSE